LVSILSRKENHFGGDIIFNKLKLRGIFCLIFLFGVLSAKGSPVQHLDAAVSGSVTGFPVSVWADQSGQENHAVSSLGSVYYPSARPSESGLSGLDFGTNLNSLTLFDEADSDGWLNQRSSSNGFCVLIAFRVDGIIGNWNDLIGNSSSVDSGFALRYSSSGALQAILGGTINRGGLAVMPGDTVVLGFNYNAANGSYDFWDSKNDGSKTGSVSAADFSEDRAVTLGAINSPDRYFNGMIGEVKVFDQALTDFEFFAYRTAMTVKWGGSDDSWRIIPESTNFPSDDVITAYNSVDDNGFANPLPADPANQDCTATFQEALDAAAAAGGGTVFVPDGE
jgi:hypothetical protein